MTLLKILIAKHTHSNQPNSHLFMLFLMNLLCSSLTLNPKYAIVERKFYQGHLMYVDWNFCH